MSNTKLKHKYLSPWEYWYWGEKSDKQIRKLHKREANRRERHINNRIIKSTHTWRQKTTTYVEAG